MKLLWLPKLLVHPRAHTASPEEGTAHSMPVGLSLDLGWHEHLQKVPVLPRSSSLLLPCGLLCLTMMGMAGSRAGAAPLCAWCTNTGSPARPLSCSQLTTTDTSGNHMAQAVAEPFWSRTCFLYFQSCCFSCERTPSSKCMPPYRGENLYRNCVLDQLNRL